MKVTNVLFALVIFMIIGFLYVSPDVFNQEQKEDTISFSCDSISGNFLYYKCYNDSSFIIQPGMYSMPYVGIVIDTILLKEDIVIDTSGGYMDYLKTGTWMNIIQFLEQVDPNHTYNKQEIFILLLSNYEIDPDENFRNIITFTKKPEQ